MPPSSKMPWLLFNKIQYANYLFVLPFLFDIAKQQQDSCGNDMKAKDLMVMRHIDLILKRNC